MKKKRIQLRKLSLNKETIVSLDQQEQGRIAGGAATQTSCECPTPAYTLDFYCPSVNVKNTCVNCIRTLLNEKTDNLCY